jgi:subtilisin family serine protease
MIKHLPDRGVAATAAVAVCLLVVAGSVAVAGAPSGAVVGEPTHNDSRDPVTDSDALASSADSGEIASELRNATGTVEVIVRFADGPAVRTTDVAGLKQRATGAQADLVAFAAGREDLTVVRQFWLMNAALVEIDTEQLSVDRLARIRGVERLHPNYEVTIPSPEPERAATDRQSAASAASSATTYGLDQINVTDAWDAFGTQGENARVAVLDTGVDADHPDIDLFTEDPSDPTYPGGWAEFDRNGDRIDSQPHDADEHGTHVSGTVAGGNASGEHIGVAPEATLLHAAVLTDCSGRCSGTFSQIVAGMEWAVEQNADVMSMSLGGRGPDADYIEPVQNAQNAGTLVVAATGNRGAGTTGSPGDIYDVTSVGASNETEGIAEFSGGREIDTSFWWGENASAHWPETYVVPDVAAPGVLVKSSIPGGGYDRFNGTSMATPHVSGVAALMVSSNSDVDPDVLAQALAGSASKPAGEPGGTDVRYGHGIVDAYHAINLVAFDSGIVGTVTSQGSPVPNAVVETDRQRVRTDENGNFELLAPPGTHEVTVSRFGYNTTSRQVTVTEDQNTRVEIATGPVVALDVVEDQPEVIESGQAVTLSLAAEHLDTLTVELRDGFDEGDATLAVDGQTASFGSPVSFQDYSGTVPITVETSENVRGELGLSITGTGPGADATLSTGTTPVFENRVALGIVGDNPDVDSGGIGLAPELKKSLREYLPLEYTIEITQDASTADEYDVLVVNGLSFVDTRELIDNTGTDDTGIVYLSDLVTYSRMTGTPEEVFSDRDSDGPLTYEVTGQHPVLGGRIPGDRILLNDHREPEHFWFEGASGEVVAAVAANGTRKGPALAVDDANNTVLAMSLGYTFHDQQWEMYTPDAHRVIRSAVKYVTPDRFDVETLELGFSPSEVEVGTDQRREIEVFARGLDAPISAYDLTIDVENPETLDIVDARLAGNPSLSEVEIAENGSRVTLAVAGEDNKVTPRFPIATITVQGSAEGVGELVFADVDVIKPDGSPHKIKDTETGVVIVSDDVQPPPVVGDDPPQDLDGDGLYEDINGDGSFTVGDVQALFDSLSSIRRQQNPQLFNFDGKEPPEVTVSDVQALFQLLQGQN